MGGLRLSSLSPFPNACPQDLLCLDCPLWSAAGLEALVKSPSPGSWSVTPGELLRLKSPQSEPCPTLSPTASSPQAPAPGLWDSERAEGLALHTNVLPIVKAPLCQRAPLRRLWGGHNGALSPSSPKQSPAFRASPHHPSPASVSGEHGGVDRGWGGEYVGSMTLPLDRLVRWAFDRAGCGG